jgi:hypothetical protein
MKRGDIVIALLLLLAVVWFAFSLFTSDSDSHAGAYAKIMVDGELFDTITLTDEVQQIEIKTNRGFNLLRVSNGGIEMIEADCPDQLCIGFGHIHKDNEKIVCLPNRVFVEIVDDIGEGEGLDAIVS